MVYLTREDFLASIHDEILDDLINLDDRALDVAELTAVSLVKDYLNARYDLTAIFAATGTSRHPSVVDAVVVITLYKLHSRLQPTAIPEHRRADYEQTLAWLKGVQAATLNPAGLPSPDEGTKDYILYGGKVRRNNSLDSDITAE